MPDVIKAPPPNLILPEPLELTTDTVTFSAKTYPIILHIYNGYILWADTYIALLETDTIAELRLEVCFDRLNLKDDTIQILTKDRDHAYELFSTERNDKGKLEVRNTLKLILVSTGTGIVGAAVGLVIGIVIIRN